MHDGGVWDQWPSELQTISSGPESGANVNPSRHEKWTLSWTLCLTISWPETGLKDWPPLGILVVTCFVSRKGSIAGHSISGPEEREKVRLRYWENREKRDREEKAMKKAFESV